MLIACHMTQTGHGTVVQQQHSVEHFTWCHINGSGEHSDKGVEGVLVESMDLVQAVQQEEQHGSSCCYSAVLHSTHNTMSEACQQLHVSNSLPIKRCSVQSTKVELFTDAKYTLLQVLHQNCIHTAHYNAYAHLQRGNGDAWLLHLVPGLIDLFLCGLGLCHLLTNLVSHTLALLQRLNQSQVLCHVTLC